MRFPPPIGVSDEEEYVETGSDEDEEGWSCAADENEDAGEECSIELGGGKDADEEGGCVELGGGKSADEEGGCVELGGGKGADEEGGRVELRDGKDACDEAETDRISSTEDEADSGAASKEDDCLLLESAGVDDEVPEFGGVEEEEGCIGKLFDSDEDWNSVTDPDAEAVSLETGEKELVISVDMVVEEATAELDACRGSLATNELDTELE
jgi:hypothetical protein